MKFGNGVLNFLSFIKTGIYSMVIEAFDWITLSAFTRNKFIKSMSYWLFITPVVANAFNKVSSINLNWIGVSGEINMSLPFSWVLFFFSAFCFGIGNLIYILKCPELIKDYSDFSDYFDKQKSTHYLVESFRRTINNKGLLKEDDTFQGLVDNYASFDRHSSVGEQIDAMKGVGNEAMPNFYSGLKLVLKDQFKYWRACATVAYLIGFMLIGIVVYQNIEFVIQNLNQ